LDFFVAAYRLTGESVLCSIENGASLFAPYTEEDEAYNKWGIFAFFTASSMLNVPVILDDI
jgi:hypothetical protein